MLRALAAALVVVVAACTTASPGDEVQVARPEVKVGERWTYGSTNQLTGEALDAYTVQVTFATPKAIGGLVTWGEGQEADASWTPEWNFVVSATEGMGAFDRIGTFDPHAGLLRFPLAAGRRWPFAYEVTLPRRGDLLLRYEGTVTALGFEEVVVPAGKFRALKLTAQATFRRVDRGAGSSMTPTNGSSLVSLWYAPEVKRWVKYESRQATNLGSVTSWRRDELQSFQLR